MPRGRRKETDLSGVKTRMSFPLPGEPKTRTISIRGRSRSPAKSFR